MKNQYIAWFDEIDKNDIARVGGKGANLGEMCKADIPVPYGFVVTSNAYFDFIKESKIDSLIRDRLKIYQYKDPRSLQETAKYIQKLIIGKPIPEKIAREVTHAYLNLVINTKKSKSVVQKISSIMKEPYVAVRSSATAEDLPEASFAGQQSSYLNVHGEASLVFKVREAWASLFTPRAIFYREEQKYDHMKVGLAVVVQLMITSDISGVMFTIDPVTNDKNRITVESIFGLGELIVQGSVNPDHHEINKKSLVVENKKISYQAKKMTKIGGKNRIVNLNKSLGSKQKISDKQVIEVAKLGLKLEKHYYFPQDIEWAIEKNNIYIIQTRPVTTIKKTDGAKESKEFAKKVETSDLKLILKGDPASPGIGSGSTKIISTSAEIHKVAKGDILVTRYTNPDFVPAMKKAVAIVTERGGRTSHAAIVSRELGIPAVVGVNNATKTMHVDSIYSVNGSKGEIYKGALSSGKIRELESEYFKKKASRDLKTATKIYVNLATPDRAREVGKMNADGIGLLRAEFMIADIGTHPKKLIKEHKSHIFVNKLSEDLIKFCQAFNPRPVVYRATDFKTNEYRNLIGGKDYEPEEPNPMLGYRGAYRYMSDPKVFELELETIKRVRNKFGFKNLWLMLPFVRTVRELVEVKKIIAGSSLTRSSSFKLWMMVEIPSNVILLDKFCEAGIDGVSIGSNDLTMLILGTDRDNTEVAPEFDERNEAVIWAIERVIKICHKYKVTSSICGQAPSDYPELVEKLVKWGITSMSVNPDAIDHVRETVFQAEKKLVQKND
ncbi:phosphoenolpyruvate synthase [Candidatus Gottesmanbacteria bacterium CG1_02_37_22]|uniref:Phosphoenolpyruvate synthase n=1 Tax=Candidatus Gottesmanbacteria bacterium CG1_02_37_22 TaxID=1805209 RepID=A0A1J4TUJ2_9BACT|nr:MAG: phosphoenolpyruvate synthase [Candidatus Gottesmanbacteria bacterium CG1_02_37_22]